MTTTVIPSPFVGFAFLRTGSARDLLLSSAEKSGSLASLGMTWASLGMTIRNILEATGSFRAEEIDVALELVDEAAAGSPDYEFVGEFTPEGELYGYACFGATPGTEGTYDLYWIAVHPKHQGTGGGSRLLDEVERRLNEREARLLVVETSARDDYESTRRFYERRGYREHARISDFYASGDDRVIYAKRLSSRAPLIPSEASDLP